MVPQSELDLDLVKTILAEYRISNADIALRFEINQRALIYLSIFFISRCDATSDELIDVVEGNRTYIPCIYVLNKIDQISIEELDIICKIPRTVPISAHHKWNYDGKLGPTFKL